MKHTWWINGRRDIDGIIDGGLIVRIGRWRSVLVVIGFGV